MAFAQKTNRLKPSCVYSIFVTAVEKKLTILLNPSASHAPKCVITSGNAVVKSVYVDSCCRDSGGAGVDSDFKKCGIFFFSLSLLRHESELLVCELQSFGEIDLSDVYLNRWNYVKLPLQPKPDLNNPIGIHFF